MRRSGATTIDDNAADEKSDMKLGLIMLAAGNSRRFGSNKLLYGIDGMPMYRHILLELKKVKAALEEQGHRCEITVVTQYEEIAQEAEKLGVRFLYNLHPDEAISSSLKIGMLVCLRWQISRGCGGRRFLDWWMCF